MKLEWRKVDRGRLVLYADDHPSMITLEFKPNEMGDHSKPFSLHGGGRFETFAALEDAKSKGIAWWGEMHELGLL
jgi:hypothetical protein